MRNFELCYRLPDTKPETWLAPQLLPPSKPSDLMNWEQPGDLALRYRYEFMPKGLISRLMVRQHRFVPKSDLGWVTGVLFERDGTQVLVEIPSEGGEIVLRARGPERKELLSVIAADLDALNDSFHGLQHKVEKLVPCICSECCGLAIPVYFEQKRLLQRKKDKKLKIECPSSYEDVDVLELLDGIRVNRLPSWAKEDANQPKNRIFSNHSGYIYGNNHKVAEEIKLRLLSLNVQCVDSEKNSTFCIIELIGDNYSIEMYEKEFTNKQVLYYCNKDIVAEFPDNSTDTIVLGYSPDSIEDFLYSLDTWLLINLKPS